MGRGSTTRGEDRVAGDGGARYRWPSVSTPQPPSVLSPLPRRTADLERLANERWDVLIVGGGIVGAGALLDATSRGLRAALIEQGDIASGTSSRSSRLIHGGLRYLEHYQFGVVTESLAECSRSKGRGAIRPTTSFALNVNMLSTTSNGNSMIDPGARLPRSVGGMGTMS